MTLRSHLKCVYLFEHNSHVHPDTTYYITCYIFNIIHAAISVLSGLLHSAHHITDYRDKIHSRVEDNCIQMSECKQHKYKWTVTKSIQIDVNGWMSCQSNFLSVFAKLQKATINFVMSVHPCLCMSLSPSACPHGTTQLPLYGFSWNFYVSIFRKSIKKTGISLKYDRNNRYLTWRPTQTYISLNSSCNDKCFRQKF